MMMSPTTSVFPLIDVAELRAQLGDPELRIIDARFDLMNPNAGRAAWVAARIPGARYAHLGEDLSDHSRAASEGRHPLPSAERLARTLAGWDVTPATPVVVYDASSGAMAAARLWWLLRWMGHGKVRVLDGGFAAWLAAGGSSVSGEAADEAADAPRASRSVTDGASIASNWRPGSAPLASVDCKKFWFDADKRFT
jgi:thiosulfate/3-mercaptopyruvate sulfurtransferase